MNVENKRSFIINFVYYLIIGAIVVLLLKYILPMLTPFVIGLLFACIMRRPTKFVSRKFKIKYRIAALVMMLLFYATAGTLIAVALIQAVSGIQSLILVIPTIYEREIMPLLSSALYSIENTVLSISPSLFSYISGFDEEILQTLGKMISSLSAWAVTTASSLATSIPGGFIKLVLMIISSFFIAADFDVLFGFCARQLSEKAVMLFGEIRQYVIGTLFVCIRSYVIIMSLTFVELSIGFSIIGLRYAFLIAALIAVFDILPVLGTGGIMLPWAVIALLCGDFKLSLSLLLIYLIITVIRNIVEPKIVGGQLGIHPVVTLVSMSLGLQLFGALGLFGLPIVLSLLRHLNDKGIIKILK